MTIPRKAVTILAVVATFLLLATAGAFAGVQLVEGNIRSFVVDISQSVPVEISAPVELESGEVITVTAPVTLNLELRVSVDGKGQAKVVEGAIEAPAISVNDAPSEGASLDSLGIPYTAEIDSPDLSLTEWTTFINPNGRVNIAGEVHLADDAQPFNDIQVVVRFYDSKGDLTALEDIANVGFRLEPGGYSRFQHFSSLELDEIGHYTVRFRVLR